jgi:hypothetical protein
MLNQMEALKINSNNEIQRLKTQIIELESMTGKVHRLQVLEGANKDLEREIRELKGLVSRVFQIFQEKLNLENKNISGYDEHEMVVYIENNIYKLPRDEGSEKYRFETEIKELKRKLSLALQGINENPNLNSSFQMLEGGKNTKISLYESLIIHLKNISLKHLLELYYVNLQREEEIKNILEKKGGGSVDYNIKKQLNDLSTNYTSLKKLCDSTFKDYENRSKMYILPEEFITKLEEYRTFTQWILDTLLNSLMTYKTELKDTIIFKLPINQYNEMLENISVHLDDFNSKLNVSLESYNKNANLVASAIEILNKQTVVDLDSINYLIGGKRII